METATKILNYCENNLQELARLSIEELSMIDGISVSQAMSLSAAFELANRKNNISVRKYKIKQSKDAFDLFFSQFEDLDHEHFYVAFLNRANFVMRCELLSVGGLSGTVVDVRMIMNRAILLKSSAIILAHNHPSGNLNPSEQDRDITKKVKEACKIFDILLMDHLILSNHLYLSFADEGYL
jgi:DNA repair protein RadC